MDAEHLLLLTTDVIPVFGLSFYSSSAADAETTEAVFSAITMAATMAADVDVNSLSSCYSYPALTTTAVDVAADANLLS